MVDQPRAVRPYAADIWVAVAVAPLVLVFAASAWAVVGWAAGGSPLWPHPDMTLSEAAGVGNAGEVVRLIAVERRDPNRSWPVREDIFGSARVMTPLEAAVAIRRMELVRVLLHYGAVPPDRGPERTTLICAAAAAAPDIAETLVRLGDGSDPRPACSVESN